jgi:MiaB/RimO family radical SAM methylthiotransferase
VKRIYIYSAGCTENIIDGTIMKNIAESNNYVICNDPKKADLIVFNTCAAKKRLEDLSVNLIQKYQEIKGEDAKLVICGCLVKINKQRLDNIFNGTSFSPTELENFYEVIGLDKPERIEEANYIPKDISDSQMFGARAIIEKIYGIKKWFKKRFNLKVLPNFNLLEYIGDENTLYVRIARGCPNQCGYCAVRFAQGKLVSHPMAEILENIKRGVREGHTKVLLAATNSSAYGKDIGTDILELLERILSLEGDLKIMVSNFEPFGIVEDPRKFIQIFSSPKMHSFFTPINGGSQYLLKRMRRNYNLKEVLDTLRTLQKLNPSLLMRTEFIVGYPGERWRDYFETIGIILRFPFNQIELHCYSPRPDTYALSLDGQLNPLMKYLRFAILYLLIFMKVILPKFRPL